MIVVLKVKSHDGVKGWIGSLIPKQFCARSLYNREPKKVLSSSQTILAGKNSVEQLQFRIQSINREQWKSAKALEVIE